MNDVVCPPFLVGNRLVLRPIDAERDVDDFWRWINDPDVRQYLNRQVPITRTAELEHLRQAKPDQIVFGIELQAGRKLIGDIALVRIDWINRHATTGTMIGEKGYWGQGYGSEAKMLLLRYAFLTLNLHRISSSVYSHNQRSLCCQLKCGYVEEGRQREMICRDGQWSDMIMLGVLRDEWVSRFGHFPAERKPAATRTV